MSRIFHDHVIERRVSRLGHQIICFIIMHGVRVLQDANSLRLIYLNNNGAVYGAATYGAAT